MITSLFVNIEEKKKTRQRVEHYSSANKSLYVCLEFDRSVIDEK